MSEYKPQEIEKKWQKKWKENQTFKTEFPSTKPKYYVLDMFPYPSGAGLHVGHPLGYIATDIVARYKRLKGYNVLHPMGYDSFGLPAEQYAVQTGQHPAITTEKNIARYREQLDNIGFSYDWSREVRTSNSDFYRWTQWIFIKIFNHWYNKETDKAEPIETLFQKFAQAGNTKVKAACDDDIPSFSAQEWNSYSDEQKHEISLKYRLAYLSNTFVNWCPGLGTVLANEEVKDGVSERGGFPVERKEMAQWSMRITAYAERLLNDLEGIEWSDSIKEQQRYWIGKSKGCMLTFQIAPLSFGEGQGVRQNFGNPKNTSQGDELLNDASPQPLSKGEGLFNSASPLKNSAPISQNPIGEGLAISVFTTRVDTIYGVTYLTLAPEHELVEKITTPAQKAKVDAYVHYAKNKSELDRQADVKTVTGEFTGAYAINPLNNALIPIWIGEYVLAGYGTGAVMAVPSSDTRDFAFAKHFNLPIINVQEGEKTDITKEDFDPKAGTMINSDFLNGMDVKSALDAMTKRVDELGVGYGKVNYKIRDSIFSRQRYWGEPIPVYFKNELPYSLEESQLPLELPKIDEYKPTSSGEPPLARAKDWTVSSPPLGEGLGVGQKSINASPQPLSKGEGLSDSYTYQTSNKEIWQTLKTNARENRKNPTEYEELMWQNLRNEKLGHKIRRQHPIDNFISDFICVPKRLIIEIDGEIHSTKENVEYDSYRTTVLNNLGYQVIRFTNAEIKENIVKVCNKIKEKLDSLPTITTNDRDLAPLSFGEGQGVRQNYPLETSTMPGWAGSSWYFLRYMDAKNESEFASKAALDYWQDVDLYLGGSEHATGHLLYSRFWHKFLFDIGIVKTKEYAKKLINQGMIQGVSAFFRAVGPGIFYIRDENHGLPDDIERPLYIVSYDLEENEYNNLIIQDLLNRNPKITESNLNLNIRFGVSQYIDIKNIENDNSIDFNEILEYLEKHEIKGKKVLISKIPNRYVCKREVEKMSKSKLNVVNPDDVVSKYGADTLRMYEMFLGPLELSKPWSTSSISGVSRFLRNVWKMFYDESGKWLITDETPNDKELKTLHKTIKKVEEDIERFSFNTSVSTFMVCVNELTELKCHKRAVLSDFLIILAPYAPHIAEELWEVMGNKEGISYAKFPAYDEKYLVESSFEYPISINGKVRHKMNFPANMDMKEVEKQALESPEIIKWLEGKTPKKVIVVPNKIVNVVL